MAGPLHGIQVIEMAGIGPAPFCAMMLADLGAEVIRIERAGEPGVPVPGILTRRRTVLHADLKTEAGVAEVLRLIETADVLIEGFRPGVMERLGLGPAVCLQVQPRLIYGRMTGWGQLGPLAYAAGHDINYIAITGALHAMGPADGPPMVPLNLLGDFGGGAMLLALGILSAVHERVGSGRGQVVDAAMVDGVATLSAMMWEFKSRGALSNQRGDNLLDGGAPFYTTYRCADGKYLAVGALEERFYLELLTRCGLDGDESLCNRKKENWPQLRKAFEALFSTRTRDEWCGMLEGTDACVSPVLDWDEAPRHPHNVARSTYQCPGGITQPSPSPRFSRTPAEFS
jgi:alpha-methylacyl-CoA racemase